MSGRYVEVDDDGTEYTESERYGGGGGCALAVLALVAGGGGLIAVARAVELLV